MGAMVGSLVGSLTDNLWVGLIAAILSSALLGLVHAVLSIKYKTQPDHLRYGDQHLLHWHDLLHLSQVLTGVPRAEQSGHFPGHTHPHPVRYPGDWANPV